MDILWSDWTEDIVGSGEVGARLEVPEGEHISFVVGKFGWYVDNLTFISSSGKPLGNIWNITLINIPSFSVRFCTKY